MLIRMIGWASGGGRRLYELKGAGKAILVVLDWIGWRVGEVVEVVEVVDRKLRDWI